MIITRKDSYGIDFILYTLFHFSNIHNNITHKFIYNGFYIQYLVLYQVQTFRIVSNTNSIIQHLQRFLVGNYMKAIDSYNLEIKPKWDKPNSSLINQQTFSYTQLSIQVLVLLVEHITSCRIGWDSKILAQTTT